MKKNVFPEKSTLLHVSNGFSNLLKGKWLLLCLMVFFAAGCKKITEEPGVNGLCPVIVSTDPTDKAVDVALTKLITATFNTDMNPATINNATFGIKQGISLGSCTRNKSPYPRCVPVIPN